MVSSGDKNTMNRIKKCLSVALILLGASLPAVAQSTAANNSPTAISSSARSATPKIIERKTDPEPTITDSERTKAILDLRQLHPQSPIDGFDLERVKGSFSETRGESAHHAADFVAERNTPVHAIANGKLARLFTSKAGGLTIYQLDPSGKYVFYYAHLEKYADGLQADQPLKRGQIIGYVGTSGNAPPNMPHLHLSIGVITKSNTWWKTADLDPYEVLKK